MAATNRERVGKALELLSEGLAPFTERELTAAYGDAWFEKTVDAITPPGKEPFKYSRNDAQFLLKAMVGTWQSVFKKVLGPNERSYAGELIDVRNKWAHQDSFSTDDAYRALDTIGRLLTSVSATEAADVDNLKQSLMRTRYEEQTRRATRETGEVVVGGAAQGARPWREVVTPHPDVSSGSYQQAEFAADLAQVVHRDEGADEYRDPVQFFRRTYLTGGLRHLLAEAVKRLGGQGGEPIIDLQTNFGGGKTHSLLALYHLFSGASSADLAGVGELMGEETVRLPEDVRRAVLVGTWMSPGQPHKKSDGTVVSTLWGELAYQLGGAEGYAMVAEADQTGTNPGTGVLANLFGDDTPTLVLIDEWVAYARQLYGKDNLPAGSFDAHFSFAQSLTEAAKATGKTLLVISIPASDGRSDAEEDESGSDIEVGGEGGRVALARLKNVIGRAESPWQPATAEESFEIVRRRLFEPLPGPEAYAARDATARSFSQFYAAEASEFPSGCKEANYEERIKAAYPIHPELFDRLYTDWSSLERFQRTRGVLRLMAKVIHHLWAKGDPAPLIMPASAPVGSPEVFSELTRYLEDNWRPVIATDVDGAASVPHQLDEENPNFGRFHACQRVARTVYLGSAPTLKSANRGIEDRQIKLGCVLPGESPAVFGDALRRLTDHCTHLYVDESRRYWFGTQPSVARLARDRAEQFDVHDRVYPEIIRILKEDRQRGNFPAIQVAPTSTAEVPEEASVRLVILGPDRAFSTKTGETSAASWAEEILRERGNSQRRFRNMVVFLAADQTRLQELEEAVRQWLAWDSISGEADPLNLDAYGRKQAETKTTEAADAVRQRIPETYCWLLVPDQSSPEAEISSHHLRVQGADGLAVRAGRKLTGDGLLVTEFGATLLRRELDEVPLWRDNSFVPIRQLFEDFAQYLYLERLRDIDVLVETVRSGVASLTWQSDTFAYAESHDEGSGRFRGLVTGEHLRSVLPDGLVVHPDAAAAQIEADRVAAGELPAVVGTAAGVETRGGVVAGPVVALGPTHHVRYHGHVSVDPVRLAAKTGEIQEAVVAHLAKLQGADVTVTLEIEASASDGFPDDVVRTVTENASTLRFDSNDFEAE